MLYTQTTANTYAQVFLVEMLTPNAAIVITKDGLAYANVEQPSLLVTLHATKPLAHSELTNEEVMVHAANLVDVTATSYAILEEMTKENDARDCAMFQDDLSVSVPLSMATETTLSFEPILEVAQALFHNTVVYARGEEVVMVHDESEGTWIFFNGITPTEINDRTKTSVRFPATITLATLGKMPVLVVKAIQATFAK